MPGPIPKRSTERVRRNKDDQLEIVRAEGSVHQPPLNIPGIHPMARDWYESLAESGQAQYYEPSDWQFARFLCIYLDEQLKSEKLSAMMLASINTAMGNLLVTEGDRRRVRLEIEREKADAKVLDLAEVFRQRQSGTGG